MKNYVFIYYSGQQGELSKDEMEKSKAAWGSWFQSLGDKIVDAGNPFADGGKAVEKSGVTTIENYPATGYTIVKASSLDEATDLAKGCPVVAVGAVRVYETLPM